MRRFALLPALLCLGLFGCEADSDDLDPGPGADGGGADAGELDDAGPRDSGPSDAGGEDAGPVDTGASDAGQPGLCGEARTFALGLSGFGPEGYEGILRARPGTELGLMTPTGDRRIDFFGQIPEAALREDVRFFGRLEVHQPFWTEARLVLWRVDAVGAPTSLALIAVSGPRFSRGRIEGVDYEFRTAGCTRRDTSCGEAEGMRLLADVRGEALEVGYSSLVTRRGFSVFAGDSYLMVDDPGCEDAPEAWSEGWIAVAAPGPLPCADLQRDDCITSPRCALWGSERDDPGYVCVPAAGECEPIADSEACRRNPVCTWDPGDCYCPEGAVCACGGGPAPKCRAVCGGFGGGLPCPGGRFCDRNGFTAPDECGPIPDAPGVCEWIPASCEGAPNSPVCACGVTEAQTYPNDCERRQAQTSGEVRGACP